MSEGEDDLKRCYPTGKLKEQGNGNNCQLNNLRQFYTQLHNTYYYGGGSVTFTIATRKRYIIISRVEDKKVGRGGGGKKQGKGVGEGILRGNGQVP